MDDVRQTVTGPMMSTFAPGVDAKLPEVAGRIGEVCAAVAAVPDVMAACRQLLAVLAEASGASRASILLINPVTGRLRLASAIGLPVDLAGQDLPYRARSISEWVVQSQRPVIVHGEVREERFEGCDDTIESALSLPIEGLNGPVGVVNLSRPVPSRRFDTSEMIAVARLCYPIGLALERVHRAVMGERCLRELEAPAGEWVSTLLPEGATTVVGYEIGFTRVPCARDAGDLCVRVPHPGGAQTIMAMDPSTSGVPSAIMSAFAHGMLAATATPERSAVALTARLNAGLHGHLAPGRHLALWVGQFTGNGQLSYCNAGMCPPLWVPADDNPPRPLDIGGPVAGILSQADYHEETLRLMPGDLVVGASNGVLLASDGAGNLLGHERLTDLLVEMRRQPLDRITRAVCEAARNLGGRTLPIDDLMVFAIRYEPGA